MTFTRCALRTVVIAAAIAWGSIDTPAQTVPPSHEHGSSSADAVPQADYVASRLASLDARIAMMIADMKMFTGDLKIQTMAALLEALAERQGLADAEMRRMHERMHGPMNSPGRHAPPPAAPPADLQPEQMCSPYI